MPRTSRLSQREERTFSQFIKARDIFKAPVRKEIKNHTFWDPTLHLTNDFFFKVTWLVFQTHTCCEKSNRVTFFSLRSARCPLYNNAMLLETIYVYDYAKVNCFMRFFEDRFVHLSPVHLINLTNPICNNEHSSYALLTY